MRIFLEKVRKHTTFSIFEPIVTEPLELLYLASALVDLPVTVEIIDSLCIDGYVKPLVDKQKPYKNRLYINNEKMNNFPDLVILNGYNVAEQQMIARAAWWKAQNENILVMASGVHVQLNDDVFQVPSVDYIFHSQDLDLFRKFVQCLCAGERPTEFEGMHINCGKGQWCLSEKHSVLKPEQILPERSFFEAHRSRLRYLDKQGIALIKGGRGCPYRCSYCYCKGLNHNHYVKPNFGQLFQEMKAIEAEHYWVVDDVLLDNQESAQAFIEASQAAEFQGKIIGYLRADFVVREKALLKDLHKAGLSEVIVGFETPDKDELRKYKKNMDGDIYGETIALLRANDIELTALFMVHPDYGFKEFKRLWQFLRQNRLTLYTISIFTPLKGSAEYEEYKDQLTTTKAEKFDFLHLVLPSKLPKGIFYTLFYASHAGLFRSKRIWKYIMNSIGR